MPRTKKVKEEVVIAEEPKEVVEVSSSSNELSFPTGKIPQRRSLLTNPRSKYYNSKIAKRRAKEKHRRKVNQLKRK